MASQQSIGTLAPLPGIGDPGQRRGVALNERLRRADVRVIGAPWLRAASLHRFVDDRPVDALDLELAPEGSLASRAGSVPRLNPRLRERRIVEYAKPEQLLNRALDKLGSIAGLRQAPPHLGNGSLAHLEEAQRRRQDDLGIVDLGMPGAFVRKRLTRTSG